MSDAATSAAQEIVDHYDGYDESERLKGDIGPLELARTQELVRRTLPRPPAVVLDVGGGPGVYALCLAGLGYDVHLVDVVPRHVEQAREASQDLATPQLASARVGDARDLDVEDGVADGVILHGPLYHLVEREERLRAIGEAGRVLRPGGILLAFAITRYAGLIYGLLQGLIFDDVYRRMIETDLRTGRREDPPAGLNTFSKAYFHHPHDLVEELQEAGLEPPSLPLPRGGGEKARGCWGQRGWCRIWTPAGRTRPSDV